MIIWVIFLLLMMMSLMKNKLITWDICLKRQVWEEKGMVYFHYFIKQHFRMCRVGLWASTNRTNKRVVCYLAVHDLYINYIFFTCHKQTDRGKSSTSNWKVKTNRTNKRVVCYLAVHDLYINYIFFTCHKQTDRGKSSTSNWKVKKVLLITRIRLDSLPL